MNFSWKTLLKMALPFIEAAGEERVAKDENDTGRDDIEGQSLIYLAKLARALVTDSSKLPKAPAILK